jgi:polysaccharide biosynthesis/export protein
MTRGHSKFTLAFVATVNTSFHTPKDFAMLRHSFASASLLMAAIWTGGLAVDAQQPQQPQPPLVPGAPADARTATEDVQWFHGGRYRLTPTDVFELTFPYVPEFNQVLTVQPDGYVTLKAVGELRVQGRTVPEIRQMLLEAYAPVLRDPVVTIVLKEFEKPYFVAAGEVKTPGKFELRGATTLTQALAVAGGLTTSGKSSEVVLFRRFSPELLEVKKIDVKKMYGERDLSEDPLMRPGDTLFVPKSLLSRIERFIPVPQLGLYLNPFQAIR